MVARVVFKLGQNIGNSELPYLGDGEKKGGRRTVNTICSCGVRFNVLLGSLTSKKPTMSCGCKHKKVMKKLCTSHGMSKTKIYEKWCHMKQRCYDIKDKRYDRYGGRGIIICDQWLNDFNKFHEWAISNGYDDTLQIDRKDNDGNYSPSNCRFISASLNARNRGVKRSNKYGISGISFDKKYQKYRAEINPSKGITKVLIRTTDFFEACCARKSAENRFWV